jgi:competence protein ComEC
MRQVLAFVLALALSVVFPAAQTRSGTTLNIYVVDVEGGNAALFLSPSGESVLIDSGNGGAAAVRDAERIIAAVQRRRTRPDRHFGDHSRRQVRDGDELGLGIVLA